ncbi:MAG TPA: hypothetical protein VNZ66_07370 [Aeromicrobium sp.]|nr:hypothetical protein [Aeromicrobium sp.]
MRDAVIYDLDGCLCDTSSIEQLVTGKDKNFHAFHAAAADCPPVDRVADAARADRAAGLAVVVVSSREFIWRDQAIDWLTRHDIGYDALYLRIVGDYRPDTVVKAEMWQLLLDDGFDPVAAWDDKQTVLDVWSSLGVTDLHLVD